MGKARARAVALVGSVVFCLAWLSQAAAAPDPGREKGPAAKPQKPKVALKELEDGFVGVDLSGLFDNDGITSEDDRRDSNFDKWKQSFSADELPEAGKFQPKGLKAAFLFPTKEARKDNNIACKGQSIPLGLKASQLHLLVTATDGNQEEKLAIKYADGNAEADLKVTDWCEKAAFGEKAGVVCPSRIAVGVGGLTAIGREERQTHIWVVSVPLDARRELRSVSLPTNPRIHIFALTLAR